LITGEAIFHRQRWILTAHMAAPWIGTASARRQPFTGGEDMFHSRMFLFEFKNVPADCIFKPERTPLLSATGSAQACGVRGHCSSFMGK
jgi:hypothetical protein